jgi:hypothetical protein
MYLIDREINWQRTNTAITLVQILLVAACRYDADAGWDEELSKPSGGRRLAAGSI